MLSVSVDPDTTLASWARASDFPFAFGSDTTGTVGRAYGAYHSQRKLDNRSLYVIGPDGRITYKVQPFNVMSQDAYTELGDAVRKTLPPVADSGP